MNRKTSKSIPLLLDELDQSKDMERWKREKSLRTSPKELYADRMRSNPTYAESLLWDELKNNRTGYLFIFQHILCGYILDFYCPERYLAVEVDGSSHNGKDEYDHNRDVSLSRLRVTTLRFSNDEVLYHLQWVIEQIQKGRRDSPPIEVSSEGFILPR